MKTIIALVFILVLIPSQNIFADPHCGLLKNFYGPFDYTNFEHRRDRLEVVEVFHFYRNIENLISADNGTLGSNLDYVLRAFPNHHRALISLSKLSLRDKVTRPEGTKYSTLCYFERAIRFKPEDATTRSIFSSHLLKIDQIQMALEQLNIAHQLEPENPTFSYNLGLLYFDEKDFNKARSFAKKAYSLGFPLPGLKEKLISVGKWEN